MAPYLIRKGVLDPPSLNGRGEEVNEPPASYGRIAGEVTYLV